MTRLVRQLDRPPAPAGAQALRGRARDGVSLDTLQVEAFALCREAARRVLGQRPYDVQVYAAMSERALFRDGQALGEVKLGDLRPEDELRPIPLPEKETWDQACRIAGAVFGATAENLYLTGSNVASLTREEKPP